jgi:hypothetical protein
LAERVRQQSLHPLRKNRREDSLSPTIFFTPADLSAHPSAHPSAHLPTHRSTLPSPTFPYLPLPSPTFPYLPLPSPTFPYSFRTKVRELSAGADRTGPSITTPDRFAIQFSNLCPDRWPRRRFITRRASRRPRDLRPVDCFSFRSAGGPCGGQVRIKLREPLPIPGPPTQALRGPPPRHWKMPEPNSS